MGGRFSAGRESIRSTEIGARTEVPQRTPYTVDPAVLASVPRQHGESVTGTDS